VLTDLAGVLQAKGDAAAAKPLYDRALTIREKVNGPESIAAAVSCPILAWLLVERRRMTDAEAMYRRVLKVYEKQYGATNRFVGARRMTWPDGLRAGARGRVRPVAAARARHRSAPRNTTARWRRPRARWPARDQLLVKSQFHAAAHQYFVALELYESALD